MSKKVDTDFVDRMGKAAAHSKVAYSPAAIAAFLGIENRQTVHNWMNGSLPRADMLFTVADKFGVDPRWFATGEGKMHLQPVSGDLQDHEADLVARFRSADPRWQLSLRLLSYLATEEQKELSSDVNILIARAFGKRPRDIKYPTDKHVAKHIGDAPHVIARKRVKETK